ncbi:hypothetical protein niasHS_013203 [Heterodera schachtii]|uniref:Uncharacterized protein n=1 Tax=Heterodera schachtii TaxID=97005 RepID=A0ABD2IAR6_HETSC
MIDLSSRLLILPNPNNFSAHWKGRKLFGFSIQLFFSVACIACTLVDIVQILLGIAVYFYPIWFRRTPFYRQILQKTDRHKFNLYYNSSILVWLLMFFTHILSTGLSIMSLQLRRPHLFVLQLVVLLFIVFSFLTIFSVSATISVVSDDSMLVSCVLSLFFFLFYGLFLAISVVCFQFLLSEYEEIQRILAKSKSVHFKEKRRKK